MKTKSYDGSDTRKILTYMVIDRTVCARISSHWPPEGLFDAQWANIVGGIIVRHFRKYGSPPVGRMVELFDDWAKTTIAGDETITAVERFLQAVSDEAAAEEQQECSEYILDVAGKYFNKVRLEHEWGEAKRLLDSWQVDEAQERIDKMQKVNLGVGSFIEPGEDADVWLRAFDHERRQPLVYYRGDLQNFFGDAFQRSRLFAFMAPDKTGKTAWLIDFVYRAVRCKNRVAFFDTGDGVEEDWTKRLGSRITGKPEFESVCKIPHSWDDAGKPVFDEKALKPTTAMEAMREFQRLCKSRGALRSAFYPSSVFGPDDIEAILEEWDRGGWRPDVVVLDYADLLSPPKGYKDSLDQIDEIWKRLRRISQKRHCLVVTATQSSSLAYGQEDRLLSRAHFSGRKTKLAHVNGMIGINVSSEEKELGLSRINWIVRREGYYNDRQYVKVAGCLAIGNPAIISKR